MPTTPEYMRENSLRDLLISLAREGMERHGMLTADLAERVGVSTKHLKSVLDKQTGGSLELWNNILGAVSGD